MALRLLLILYTGNQIDIFHEKSTCEYKSPGIFTPAFIKYCIFSITLKTKCFIPVYGTVMILVPSDIDTKDGNS